MNPARFKLNDPYQAFPYLIMLGGGVVSVILITELLNRFELTSGALLVFDVVFTIYFALRFTKTYAKLGNDSLEQFRWGVRVLSTPYSAITQAHYEDEHVKLFLASAQLPRGVKSEPGWLILDLKNPQRFLEQLRLHVDDVQRFDSDWKGKPLSTRLGSAPGVAFVPAERWRRVAALAVDLWILISISFSVALAYTNTLKEGEHGPERGALFTVAAWFVYLVAVNITGGIDRQVSVRNTSDPHQNEFGSRSCNRTSANGRHGPILRTVRHRLRVVPDQQAAAYLARPARWNESRALCLPLHLGRCIGRGPGDNSLKRL